MSSRLLAGALSTLLAITLPLLSLTSQAAEPASQLLQLHQLRLAAQKSLGDFYMFNGMEGDQRYERMINESLAAANGHLEALVEMPGDGSKALRVQLEQQWQGYQADLNTLTAALKTNGFTDLQPLAKPADAGHRRLLRVTKCLSRRNLYRRRRKPSDRGTGERVRQHAGRIGESTEKQRTTSAILGQRGDQMALY